MPPDGWCFEGVDDDQEPGQIWWIQTLAMPAQYYGWTCSVCSLDWVLRATGIDPRPNLSVYESRFATCHQIGYTENVNPTWGLMDATGTALMAVLREYNQPATSAHLDFYTVYQYAQITTGMMSGAAWYHWIALRGVQGDALWIANSAPGYKGIYDTLTKAQFDALGPFNVVLLE